MIRMKWIDYALPIDTTGIFLFVGYALVFEFGLPKVHEQRDLPSCYAQELCDLNSVKVCGLIERVGLVNDLRL